MAKLLGNISSKFDCDALIEMCDKLSCLSVQVGFGEDILDDDDDDDYDTIENDISSGMEKAGIRWDLVSWNHLSVPENSKHIKVFSKIVKQKCLRAFVSKVGPGNAIPVHWDACDSQLISESNKDKIYRYVVFLNTSDSGQVFVLKDDQYYNQIAGNLYLWDNFKDFHSLYNVSTTPNYLFHFVGTTEGYDD